MENLGKNYNLDLHLVDSGYVIVVQNSHKQHHNSLLQIKILPIIIPYYLPRDKIENVMNI